MMNKYIDHTILKAVATEADVKKICVEAAKYQFASVCIPPSYVALASKELKGSGVDVCTVIGFPLGNTTCETKVFETKDAISKGATEIDMVINVGALKSGNWAFVLEEIKAVKAACGKTLLKVIVETCYLTNEEIAQVTEVVLKSGAEFIKTSTGFGTRGATVEDVEIFMSVAPNLAVKASGGVRDKETAEKYIAMGVKRLGTSSGVQLVEGQEIKGGY